MLERIGKTAYKLQLPCEAHIHPIFHVSQLKLVMGDHDQGKILPPGSITDVDDVIVPEEVLAKRYNAVGNLELLVKLMNRPSLENSWVLLDEFVTRFPDYQLEGKLDFAEGSIDRYKKVYIRKRRKGVTCEGRDELAREQESSGQLEE